MFFGIRVCTPKTVNWSCKRNQNQLTDRHSDIDILGSLLTASLEPLAHCQNVTNLSLSYRHFFGRCSPELAQLVPLLFSQGRSTCYSDKLHDFSITIPTCYKDIYVNSFFPHTARLRNSPPIECFPLTYDLNGFKSRILSK